MGLISIVACIADSNNAIGKGNDLIYHIPQDMKDFKNLTTGHAIIMGRKTFESLPNGALPNRRNIVVSKTITELPNCEVYPSLEKAIKACGDEDIYIIGGASIYQQAMETVDVDRLFITHVLYDEPKDATAFFPQIPEDKWRVTFTECYTSGGYQCEFRTYHRNDTEF